jgi:TolA-binding protein
MTDPRPLLDEGASDFEARLLRAGRLDAPTNRGRRRILVGLGIGGILTTTAVTTGANASIKGWLAAAGGGTLSALAIWTGVEIWQGSDQAETVAPVAAVKAAAPVRAREASPPEAKPVEPPPVVEPAPAPERAKPAPEAANLTQELAMLEEARRALAAKDYGLALKTLDDYSRTMPRRKMGSEATVLRIETLSAKGDEAAARELGKSFLRAQPRSPYAKRVRSLIGES